MIDVERLIPAALILGEGPIRRGDGDGFACVDIRNGLVLEGDLCGRFGVSARFDTTVSAVAELDDGSLLTCAGDEIRTIDGSRSIRLPQAAVDVRLNDGKPDPGGRFIVGTMADPPQQGVGSLWSCDRGRSRALLDGITISNGLCWSSDGSTLYYIDTPKQQIEAFDYDCSDGSISERRVVVSIDSDAGSPDGMTIDADGGLWVALWGGGAVHRYANGRLDSIVEVPTPFVTCPAFVGPDLSTLLITTASEPNPGSPGAGDLYTADPGISGPAPLVAVSDIVFGTLAGEPGIRLPSPP